MVVGMRSVSEIIEAAGGARRIGKQVGLRDGVRKWPSIGIPDRHWPWLMRSVPGLTAAELLAANQSARAPAEEAAVA